MEQKTNGGSSSSNKSLTLADIFFFKNKTTLRRNIIRTIASFAFVPPMFRLLLTCKEFLATEEKIFQGYRLPTVSGTSTNDEWKMYCLLVRTPNSRRLQWLDTLKVKNLELPKGTSILLVGVFRVERFAELLSNWKEVTATFEDMELKEDLLRGIYANGFETPTHIQQRCIVPILQGCDTFVQGDFGVNDRLRTDTFVAGKTSALSIAILQSIDTDVVTGCQALVMTTCKTKAWQLAKLVGQLGNYLNIKVHAFLGGRHVREDIRVLNEGVHIVVGTPGRSLDMINRGVLRLDDVKLFCLDGVEEMLSRGFKDSIYDMFKFLPEKVQVCLFSATMSLEVFELSQRSNFYSSRRCVFLLENTICNWKR